MQIGVVPVSPRQPPKMQPKPAEPAHPASGLPGGGKQIPPAHTKGGQHVPAAEHAMPSRAHDCPPAPLAPPPPEPAAPSVAPAPPAASVPPLFLLHATAAISRNSASPCKCLMWKAYTGS